MALLSSSADGGTIFRDTFSDGDAEDGRPVKWIRANGDSEIAVENGDLVARDLQFRGGVGAKALTVPFDNTSLRTQFRLLKGFSIGASIRDIQTSPDPTAYAAELRADGTATLRIVKGDVTLSTDTDLNVMEEDVVMQFDAFGNTMRMWLWRPGERMPVEPLLTLTDDQLPAGKVNVGGTGNGEHVEAVFRYVHLADMHIPEPSTFLLASLGLLFGLACARRLRVGADYR